MDRRPIKLVVDVLLMLVGTLLGIATNYATGQSDHVPLALRLLRDWAVAGPCSPGEDTVGTLQRRLAQLPEERPALLVIDQLEELLTLSGREERDAFVTAVRDALRRDSRLWLVATLRSDFLTGFLESG